MVQNDVIWNTLLLELYRSYTKITPNMSFLQYMPIYASHKSPNTALLDIVNCENDDGCHDNATCTDDNGSYTCVCKDGFTGDGFNCTGNKLILFHFILMV